MDARIHANVHEAHSDPTSRARNVGTFPPEIIDIVLSHVEGDIATLRCCTLVCASWAALSRPYLFRKVSCWPALTTRTWDDFFRFLSTSHDVVRHMRCLTVDGGKRRSDLAVDNVAIENVREALKRMPSLSRLCIKGARFKPKEPVEQYSQVVAAARLSPHPRACRLKVLALEACPIDGLLPLHHLLTSLARIETLVLYDVPMSSGGLTLLPPLDLRIDSIHVDASYGDRFWPLFRRCLAPGATSGLSISTRLIPDMDHYAFLPLSDVLLNFCKGDVRMVSINVLGASYDLRYMIEEGAALTTDFPPFPHFPGVFLSSSVRICSMALYLTTTRMKTGRDATRLYARLLENNWSVLSESSTSLASIELRFQRYGPHTPAMIHDLLAINDDTANSGPVSWSTVDEGTLARFPGLEAFTCTLCDGRFVEHYGPFEGAEPDASGSRCSRQQEFDDYVELLKGVLPRLHERGILRFRMSDV